MMVYRDRNHMVARRWMGCRGMCWEGGREEQADCYERENHAWEDQLNKKSLEHEIVFLSLSGFQDDHRDREGRPDSQ
jgi:hypothetical protein